MKIAGANVIVTGGAQGFGQAFTEALLKGGAKIVAGGCVITYANCLDPETPLYAIAKQSRPRSEYHVCFADVNEEVGRKTEAEFHKTYDRRNCFFVQCDISKESDFKALFEKTIEAFGHVDILVNNAGILNETNIAKTIEVNLMGTITGTNLAIDHMRKDKGGKGGLVVNVASIAGVFPAFFMPAYCASKHGMVGYTRSWATNPLNEHTYELSFACLCPAFSETNMLSGTLNAEDPPLVTYKENKLAVLAVVNSMGINTVASVTDAFMELVQKEDNNGSVVTVDSINGTKYRYKNPHKF